MDRRRIDSGDFEDPAPVAAGKAPLLLTIDGYEGPIDMLLALAREQKVDLTRISILELVEQYIAFIREARTLNLEIAADYLVMAAWLAYLKSRLLLPEPEAPDEPSAEELAETLRLRLRRLEAMRDAGIRLMARPRLGVDRFPRGAPEPPPVEARTVYVTTLHALLSAHGRRLARTRRRTLRIEPTGLVTVEEAVRRLRPVLGKVPNWRSLFSFLPPGLADGLVSRSAIAATFAASLELAREGALELRQDEPFGPVYLRGGRAGR